MHVSVDAMNEVESKFWLMEQCFLYPCMNEYGLNKVIRDNFNSWLALILLYRMCEYIDEMFIKNLMQVLLVCICICTMYICTVGAGDLHRSRNKLQLEFLSLFNKFRFLLYPCF